MDFENIKHAVIDKVLTTVISAVILVPVGAAGMKIWENSESSSRKFGLIMGQQATQGQSIKKNEENIDALRDDLQELKDIVKSLHLDKHPPDR